MGHLGVEKCTFAEKVRKVRFDRKSRSETSVKRVRGAICQKVKIFVIFKKIKKCKKSLSRFCIRVRGNRGSWEVQIAKVRFEQPFALWRARIGQVGLFHTTPTFLLDLGAPKSLLALLELKVI